jgi:acetyl-CoA acetyltransferase family protein
MKIPVIVSGARTPFCRSHNKLKDFSTFDLGRFAIKAAMTRPGLSDFSPDHIIMGCVVHDPPTPNIARECLLGAGLSNNIPAHTVSLACISSNVAATQAADMIRLGNIKSAIAGGVDTFSDPPIRISKKFRQTLVKMSKFKKMSDIKKLFAELATIKLKDFSLDTPTVTEFSNGKSMGQGAELLAQQTGASRKETDDYARRSHELALHAIQARHFEDFISPVYAGKNFTPCTQDDGPRKSTAEALAKIRPAFERNYGICTAGNSSFLTDGAAAITIMEQGYAKSLGLKAQAIIKDYVYTASDPLVDMLSGPAYSIPKLLKKTKLSVSDIDVWEIHEAFAAQMIANLKLLDSKEFAKNNLGESQAVGEIPLNKLNLWGGSLSLGHPFGATGARLLYTASKRLEKENGKFAIVSGCAAGGHGSAILLERPSGE